MNKNDIVRESGWEMRLVAPAIYVDVEMCAHQQ